MVVKTVINVPAALYNAKNTAADEYGRVVHKSVSVGLEKLVFFVKQLAKAGSIHLRRHFLKTQYIRLIAEVYVSHVKIAVVNITAPDVVGHYSEI